MQILNQSSPFTRWHTLPLKNIHITSGFWTTWQNKNRQASLFHAYEMLEQAGNFNNLRLVLENGGGSSSVSPRGGSSSVSPRGEEYRGYVFQDSDIYKWLEAVSIELGKKPDPELEVLADHAIDLIEQVQQPDGYINSCFQSIRAGQRWTDLDHGHEMYCAGHLIEAGIAHHRATGKTRLLAIACRFADHIDSIFGPQKRQAACGHPEIEHALVELYRETGEKRYLDLAGFLIDQRGQKKMRGYGSSGPEYHQDRVPFREAQVVEGHAVRQLYLAAGAADVYMETGDPALLQALERIWEDMAFRKTYLTGAFGSRANGESFGDAYELPSEQCYGETCAAIAAMMWNWRMLLVTGQTRYGDLLERSLYNGFLSGAGLDGRHYFYVNPLQSQGVEREEWLGCACCPPNVMRQIGLLEQYLASTDRDGIQIHQYASSQITLPSSGLASPTQIRVETNYPWDGNIHITVEQTAAVHWKLSLRIPSWCKNASIWVNGSRYMDPQPGTYAVIEREWVPCDVVTLTLPIEPRLTSPNAHIDVLRGCLAIERGPLVYCLEANDQPAALHSLAAARLRPDSSLRSEWRRDLLGGMMIVEAQGAAADARPWDQDLYPPAGQVETTHPQTFFAIPYYAWANRGVQPMRVWIPKA
jgi:uncharacterized protein